MFGIMYQLTTDILLGISSISDTLDLRERPIVTLNTDQMLRRNCRMASITSLHRVISWSQEMLDIRTSKDNQPISMLTSEKEHSDLLMTLNILMMHSDLAEELN